MTNDDLRSPTISVTETPGEAEMHEQSHCSDNQPTEKTMPAQEICLELTANELSLQVLRTFDRHFAREVFDGMDDVAQSILGSALGFDDSYDSAAAPAAQPEAESQSLLWEETVRAAGDLGPMPAFFVVVEGRGPGQRNLYVSPDRSSAEDFARALISDQQQVISS